jgi:hypothetical protein
LHLLFGLGAGSGRIWIEPSAQAGILSSQPIVLGYQDRHLLLGNLQPSSSIIPLLLPDLRSVPP